MCYLDAVVKRVLYISINIKKKQPCCGCDVSVLWLAWIREAGFATSTLDPSLDLVSTQIPQS